MLNFIEKAFNSNLFNNHQIQPWHVERDIIYNNFSNFKKVLFDNLQDYYRAKGHQTLLNNEFYVFNIINEDGIFIIEFSNIETKRCITIRTNVHNGNLIVHLYNNYCVKGKNKDSIKKPTGMLVLTAEDYMRNVCTKLLEIFYNFMEDNLFDEETLFNNLEVH